MTIEEIPPHKYARVLRGLFYEDDDLLSKYHIDSGSGIKKCVDRTVSDMAGFKNYKFYVIKDGEEIVSFFGKEEIDQAVFMTGFYVKIKYRNKEFISYFWEQVQKTMGSNNIFSTIYKKNTRAADFLSKKGSVVYSDENVLTYKIF